MHRKDVRDDEVRYFDVPEGKTELAPPKRNSAVNWMRGEFVGRGLPHPMWWKMVEVELDFPEGKTELAPPKRNFAVNWMRGEFVGRGLPHSM